MSSDQATPAGPHAAIIARGYIAARILRADGRTWEAATVERLVCAIAAEHAARLVSDDAATAALRLLVEEQTSHLGDCEAHREEVRTLEGRVAELEAGEHIASPLEPVETAAPVRYGWWHLHKDGYMWECPHHLHARCVERLVGCDCRRPLTGP